MLSHFIAVSLCADLMRQRRSALRGDCRYKKRRAALFPARPLPSLHRNGEGRKGERGRVGTGVLRQESAGENVACLT
jgi:hypothetical protein